MKVNIAKDRKLKKSQKKKEKRKKDIRFDRIEDGVFTLRSLVKLLLECQHFPLLSFSTSTPAAAPPSPFSFSPVTMFLGFMNSLVCFLRIMNAIGSVFLINFIFLRNLIYFWFFFLLFQMLKTARYWRTLYILRP